MCPLAAGYINTMLDIKFIRENKDLVQEGARKKHLAFKVDELLAVDDERRELLAVVEKKRGRQNEITEKIAVISHSDVRDHLIGEMRGLKEELQRDEEKLKEITKRWQLLMLQVPNIPDITVPKGKDDSANVEIRAWGEKPVFDFNPKSHIELMKNLDLADFERGAKVAGFRGYFLKNDGVLLCFALFQFTLDFFRDAGGFTPIIAPSLVKRETLLGTGYLPQGEEDLYKTQDESYLAGTAEVAIMNYSADETLPHDALPIKFIGFSPCFRREAGSYGRDTRGILRVHEFFKLEQVVLCEAKHETSVRLHEELTMNAEKMMQRLNIPHRVVINCGGDLGLGQVKKYDIEAWVPSEKKYRETHSSSYFHDFQTRRLNIRYRDENGTSRFAHSLNNTALATPRLLVPLLENNQQKDGSVMIPEALEKYMGKKFIASAVHTQQR